jgi:N-acetylglucosamine kinase-like BadF-type ATPase
MSDYRPMGRDRRAMRHVIGIDAGGTKTVGLLADERGAVVREARAGGANLVVHGELGVEKTLWEVVEALEAPKAVAATCLGIAGADREGDREVLAGVLSRLGLHRRVRIVNDARIALVAGSPGGTGIVVVAGTGSIAYGVDPSGKTARAGGWGYLLADEGSAFWLGHAAVRLGVRAADGRGAPTTLYERIRRKLGLDDTAALVKWFYDQELSRYRVAELASLVDEAAAAGDEAAETLLEQAADHLARAARAVKAQLDFPGPFALVLSGGAFRACPSLAGRVERSVELDGARVVRLAVEPACGAVKLALDALAG